MIKQLINLTKKLEKKIRIKGQNNSFDLDFLNKNKIYLRVEGDGNEIIAGKSLRKSDISIQIYGDNNKIIIGDNLKMNGIINIGFKWHNKTNNSTITIGNNVEINGANILLLEPNSQIRIGNNCLFANDIDIWASDTHSIVDSDGNLLNYGGHIEIGDHVWIGKNVKISKFAKISDNSIIGWSSVVSKKFEERNVIIAGNPAKVIKNNVNWDNLSPHNYKTAHLS